MGIPSDRLLPSLAHQSFAEVISKKSPLAKPKAKVAFFAGCVVNYATPQLGLDVYDILAANNIQMVTYKKEACCGLAAIMSVTLISCFSLGIVTCSTFTK